MYIALIIPSSHLSLESRFPKNSRVRLTIRKAAEISINHRSSGSEITLPKITVVLTTEYFRAKLPSIAEDSYEFNATYVASANKRRESFCKVSAYKHCFRSPKRKCHVCISDTRCVTFIVANFSRVTRFSA